MGEGNELTVEQIHRVVPQIIHEYVVSRKVRVFDEGPKNETTPWSDSRNNDGRSTVNLLFESRQVVTVRTFTQTIYYHNITPSSIHYGDYNYYY